MQEQLSHQELYNMAKLHNSLKVYKCSDQILNKYIIYIHVGALVDIDVVTDGNVNAIVVSLLTFPGHELEPFTVTQNVKQSCDD